MPANCDENSDSDALKKRGVKYLRKNIKKKVKKVKKKKEKKKRKKLVLKTIIIINNVHS